MKVLDVDSLPTNVLLDETIEFCIDYRLTNIPLRYHEGNWLKYCPKDFEPNYCKRYSNDIFILFNKPYQIHFFS